MVSMTGKLDTSRLEALLESAQLLQASLDLDTLLRHLLRTVMARLLARRGLVAVRDRNGELQLALVRGVPALAVGEAFREEAARAGGIQELIPIGPPAEPVGVLGLGGLPASGVDPEEQDFVLALLGLAASVISNAQAHDQAVATTRLLDQRLQELRALLDLGRGLAATLDPEEVAKLVGLTLSGRWAISKYAVLAWRSGEAPISRTRGWTMPAGTEWQAKLVDLADAMTTAELPDPTLAEELALPPGALLMPLRSSSQIIGLIICGPRPRGVAYSEVDREFGAGLAAQAAIALENAWNFKDTLLRQQMEKELFLAAQIQQDLFPKRMPDLKPIEIAARNRQARHVGGDYYDALPFAAPSATHPYLLCVADIAGKGLPASLLMSNIQATLRALLHGSGELTQVAFKANDLLYASTPVNRYATAFLLALDPKSGNCEFVNCGHNSAILLRADGTTEMLDCTGLALGLFPKAGYESGRCELRPGDLLAIYTDGVTEAWDEQENEFDIPRLIDCLKQHRALPTAALVDKVFEALDEFAGAAPQHDDITLMLIKSAA